MNAPQLLIDDCGRRLGIDRREFLYAIHIPERRSGNERRCGGDRRNGKGFRFLINSERRAVSNFVLIDSL